MTTRAKTAPANEKARLMLVAVWKRGGFVKIHVETIPPVFVVVNAHAIAVARRK